MNESLLLRVPGLCSGSREFQERFDSPIYVKSHDLQSTL